MGSPQMDNTCGADSTLPCERLWKRKILQSDTLTRGLEELPGHAAKHWFSFVLRVWIGEEKP